MDLNKTLKESINLHWLRPDNALWVYGFSLVFGGLCMQKTKAGRSMDLGCGDGTTSFIMLGGEFDRRFDVYHSVQTEPQNLETDQKRSESGSLKDEQGDFYNTYDASWRNAVNNSLIRNTKSKYTVGSDWKDVLVNKAFDLGLYEETAVYDANIFPYPHENEKFDFIFSTIIYWLENPAKVLSEIHRLLGEHGVFAFSAPKPNIIQNTLTHMLQEYNYPLLSRLDRGRNENWDRHCQDYGVWKQKIEAAGFEILEYREFHPALQIAYGETIIRTLMSAYKVLYDRLLPDNEDVFLEFKENWCSEIEILLKPFADEEYYSSLEKAYHAFILKKI